VVLELEGMDLLRLQRNGGLRSSTHDAGLEVGFPLSRSSASSSGGAARIIDWAPLMFCFSFFHCLFPTTCT
jgi:hypothetical protein